MALPHDLRCPLATVVVPSESRATSGIGVVTLLVVLAAFVLAGCAAHTVPSGAPHPNLRGDSALPPGWVRHSYGLLSVGAPSAWKLSTIQPPNCGSPPNHTVTEITDATVTASACPSISSAEPAVSAVVIECLVGKANGLYSGFSASTVVGGQTMYRNGTVVYLQGGAAQGVVYLPDSFGPAPLADEILGTVAPSGKPC
jgi:hypothetical protein